MWAAPAKGADDAPAMMTRKAIVTAMKSMKAETAEIAVDAEQPNLIKAQRTLKAIGERRSLNSVKAIASEAAVGEPSMMVRYYDEGRRHESDEGWRQRLPGCRCAPR